MLYQAKLRNKPASDGAAARLTSLPCLGLLHGMTHNHCILTVAPTPLIPSIHLGDRPLSSMGFPYQCREDIRLDGLKLKANEDDRLVNR